MEEIEYDEQTYIAKKNDTTPENKDDILQDDWLRNTDQQLKQRLNCTAVRILPESTKIIGEKLYLRADESCDTKKTEADIASVFNLHINDVNINNGYFFADRNIDRETKTALSERTKENFVNFHPLAIIDGFIKQKRSPIKNLEEMLLHRGYDFSFDKNDRLQVTIADIKKLETLAEQGIANIKIPEKTSIVLPVRPNPVYFLSKEFPNITFGHNANSYVKKEEDSHEDKASIRWYRTIEVSDGYFNDTIYNRLYDEIGLSFFAYEYTFFVNPCIISKYNPETSPYILPPVNTSDSSFTFLTRMRDVNIAKGIKEEADLSKAYNEEKHDFELKYMRLKKFFEYYFGAENVRFAAKFIYNYDLRKFESEYLPWQKYDKADFWSLIYSSFNNANTTISENTESVGIDFNWKYQQMEDVIAEVLNNCDVLNFSFFKNHKCNFDFQVENVELDEAECRLRDAFPSIQIKRDDKNGFMYFYQEYETQEEGNTLRVALQQELEKFDDADFETSLNDIPQGKEKYILEIDAEAKKESETAIVKEFRSAVFSVNGYDFGTLTKVNYPQLVFDISGDNFEKTKQLFVSQTINVIESNRTEL